MAKRMFKYGESSFHIWLLLLRVTSGAFMLTHGLPKLEKLLAGDELKFSDPVGMGPAFTLIFAVFAEVVCAVLVGLGLFTRLAVIPLLVTMVVAAFIVKSGEVFREKEMALLYLLIYLTIFLFGSGKYALDNYLRKGK